MIPWPQLVVYVVVGGLLWTAAKGVTLAGKVVNSAKAAVHKIVHPRKKTKPPAPVAPLALPPYGGDGLVCPTGPPGPVGPSGLDSLPIRNT